MILFAGICLLNVPQRMYAQSAEKNKINLSLNIPKRSRSSFNLGLVSDVGQLKGLGISLFSSRVNEDMYGVQLTGISSFLKGKVRGMQIGGLSSIASGDFRGVALSGMMTMSTYQMRGVQLSGMMNVQSERMNGLQLSGISNVGVDVRGMQLSGVLNISQQQLRGVQLGCANYAGKLNGVQLGLLNLCGGEVKGCQIGVINYSRDTTAYKVGLVNVTPKTRIQLMIFGGNVSKSNIAVRFKNRWNYTILGAGTHFLDLSRKFSGCLFYRNGFYYSFAKRWEVSGDLGYFHVENFQNANTRTPESMYSLQGRINIEFKLHSKIGLFASGGYSFTRYYQKNRCFERKPIGELGLVFF